MRCLWHIDHTTDFSGHAWTTCWICLNLLTKDWRICSLNWSCLHLSAQQQHLKKIQLFYSFRNSGCAIWLWNICVYRNFSVMDLSEWLLTVILNWIILFQEHIDPLSNGWGCIKTHSLRHWVSCAIKPRLLRPKSGRSLGSPAQLGGLAPACPLHPLKPVTSQDLCLGMSELLLEAGALGELVWSGKREDAAVHFIFPSVCTCQHFWNRTIFFSLTTKCNTKWINLQFCEGALLKIPLGNSS